MFFFLFISLDKKSQGGSTYMVKNQGVMIGKPQVPFTTPDILKLRHVQPQTNITKTHQTSDKEYRAANNPTDKNTFSQFNWNPI